MKKKLFFLILLVLITSFTASQFSKSLVELLRNKELLKPGLVLSFWIFLCSYSLFFLLKKDKKILLYFFCASLIFPLLLPFSLPEEGVHLVLYMAIPLLLNSIWGEMKKGFLLTVAISFALAFAGEGLQYFVPSRVFDFNDFLLNLCGVSFGLLPFFLYLADFRKLGKTLLLLLPLALFFITSWVYLCIKNNCYDYFFKHTLELNVVLITADALRPDHLGCYGYSRNTSPNIDKLSKESTFFQEVIAQGGWTTPALISLFTGLPPYIHKITDRQKDLKDGMLALPLIFRQNNFLLPHLSYLISIPGYRNIGYYPKFDIKSKDLINDRSNVPANWLSEFDGKKNFFLWYHYRFIHLPFNPSSKYDVFYKYPEKIDESPIIKRIKTEVLFTDSGEVFSEEEKKRTISLYDGEVLEFDNFIGEILETLKRKELLEKTIFILTSDHGEELFDHNNIGHSSTSLKGTLFEEVIKIPLLIRFPGKKYSQKIETPVRQIDITPTLTDYMKLKGRFFFIGKSLIPCISEKNCPPLSIISENSERGYQEDPANRGEELISFRKDKKKLILHLYKESENRNFFDLSLDPKELNDISFSEMKRINEYKEELSNILKRHKKHPYLDEKFFKSKERNHVTSNTTAPEIILPKEGENLSFEHNKGFVSLKWKGKKFELYEIRYEVGTGLYKTNGSFEVTGNFQNFGPYGREMFSQLKKWNPWSFKVCLKNSAVCSNIRTFNF